MTLLSIQGMDGLSLELQVNDESSVQDVSKHIAKKIDMKPARMLKLTSGDNVLDESKPLLKQVSEGKIDFIVSPIGAYQAAKSFWRSIESIEDETKGSLTLSDLYGLEAIASLTFKDNFEVWKNLAELGRAWQSVAGVALPSNLQTLSFGERFNDALEGITLPTSLQTLTFGRSFNQSLAGVGLPLNLQTLIFGEEFNQSLESTALPMSLQTLIFGKKFNQSLEGVTLPGELQTLVFHDHFQKEHGCRYSPSQLAIFDLWPSF